MTDFERQLTPKARLAHDLPCIVLERSLSPALHDAIAALYRQAHIRPRVAGEPLECASTVRRRVV